MTERREQLLIDIAFSLVLTSHDPEYREKFNSMSREELAAWVTKQLRACGFDIEPCGASWGVLK